MPREPITPMRKYIVVKFCGLKSLVLMVNDFMRTGYAPVGGIAYDSSDFSYMQAMVLE